MSTNNGVYERFNLYSTLDAFYLEPRTKEGTPASDVYLYIDKVNNEFGLANANERPIPQASVRPIYGLWGIISLVAGNYLVVITKAEIIGTLNGADIYHIRESDLIPYKENAELHLTPKQNWYNNNFLDMLRTVLSIDGFYYSPTFDLSRSLQFLGENTSPDFVNRSLYDRAANWLCWNSYLISPLSKRMEVLLNYPSSAFRLFMDLWVCANVSCKGRSFKLILISRRPVDRPGVRFMVRGSDEKGSVANFVETEQIVELDNGTPESRRWTSFLQFRGSIPLLWSQKPNLRWQPQPYMRPHDDQLDAYIRHMRELKRRYGGSHVIVNLVNQRGREHRVGSELARVSLQASLDFVRYVPFDFHGECKNLDWSGLTVLRRMLEPDIQRFGFFASSIAHPAEGHSQTGYFRTNCMDCLDRTNVGQAMIAKESLKYQLRYLGIINETALDLDAFDEFSGVFRNLWADNGDECSLQYAGTGALKTDYTRFGKRTFNGVLNDGINALTRYFKNNFTDGHKLDAMHLFLGYYPVSLQNLPERMEEPFLSYDAKSFAITGAIIAAAMVLLCLLVSENFSYTLFWLIIFIAFGGFILINGEEFVRQPKLKIE
ncbi:SAC domain-containing protein [Aphelenchoides bicaudatus]|nr:SAC domain-containing protein [Aphelenchoides bicaudatus]